MPTDPNPTSGGDGGPAPAGRRPRAWLRVAALIVALLLMIPAALIGVAATLLPTEVIARAAAERAEAALGLPVAIAELEVDLWPVPSVLLAGTRVGTAEAPVARVEQILLRPRLLPLLSGRVTVREIAIDRPDIRLEVDSAGVLNLPFSSGKEEPDAASREVDFAVDAFRIRDGRLSYADARDGTEVVVNGLQQTLRIDGRVGDGGLERIGLTGRLSSDSSDVALPDRLAAPLRGVSFALNHDARLDRAADRLEIADLRLQLQRIAMTGSGRIEAVGDSLRRSADLQLRADEFSFEDLARSLPEGFLAGFLTGRVPEDTVPSAEPPAEMRYAGRAEIAATVSGPLTTDSIPRVAGTVELREVAAARDGASLLDATGGSIRFSNDQVVAERVAGRLFGEPFALSLRISDLADPLVAFAARGTARVEELLALMESDEPIVASGRLPFDLRGELRPSAPAASSVEGTIGLGGARLQLPSLLQPVDVSSGTVRFAGETLELVDVALGFGESRVRARGSAEGWLPAALGDSSSIAVVRFDATAAMLDLDALLGPSESEYTPLLFARLADRPVDGRSAAEAAAELGLSLPELPRVRAQGELRADRLVRNGLTYDQLEVSFESSPTAVSAPRVRFGLMGGTVDLGIALERGERDATLVAVYHLENVGAEAFFSRFTPFQGRLSGLMSLDGEVSLQLDEQMLPVRPSVRSAGRVALTSGSLANWPLLGAVGERLGLASFDTLSFREWAGEFTVAGPLVSLDRSVQVSGGVQSELAGSFDFGGRLDLGVVARLSPALVAGAGEQVRAAASSLAGEAGSVPVGLRITGTTTQPSIALDLTGARDEALARARERATEEADAAARRAAAEVARRALGDSVGVAPEQIGEAVRGRVQNRIRGLFGRREATSATDSIGQRSSPEPAADSVTVDTPPDQPGEL